MLFITPSYICKRAKIPFIIKDWKDFEKWFSIHRLERLPMPVTTCRGQTTKSGKESVYCQLKKLKLKVCILHFA